MNSLYVKFKSFGKIGLIYTIIYPHHRLDAVFSRILDYSVYLCCCMIYGTTYGQ